MYKHNHCINSSLHLWHCISNFIKFFFLYLTNNNYGFSCFPLVYCFCISWVFEKRFEPHNINVNDMYWHFRMFECWIAWCQVESKVIYCSQRFILMMHFYKYLKRPFQWWDHRSVWGQWHQRTQYSLHWFCYLVHLLTFFYSLKVIKI